MGRLSKGAQPMKTKQCKMTQREINFVQMYADRLEVTWSDALRRLIDTYIERYEDNKK